MPGAGERLTGQIVRFVQALRQMPLDKAPGVAKSLDWAPALVALNREELDAETVMETMGCVLKTGTDQDRLRADALHQLLATSQGR